MELVAAPSAPPARRATGQQPVVGLLGVDPDLPGSSHLGDQLRRLGHVLAGRDHRPHVPQDLTPRRFGYRVLPGRIQGGVGMASQRLSGWLKALRVYVVATIASCGLAGVAAAPAGATLTQQARLAQTPPEPESRFGASVALSSTGNTALVGSGGGATAWVFARSKTSWAQQAALTSFPPSGSPYGTAVALSSTGSIALVGGPAEESGFAYVWAHSESGWTQTERIDPPEEAEPYGFTFGESVALSAGGTVAIIGNAQTVFAYTHTKTGWVYSASFGHAKERGSVAISGNGLTALVGGGEATTAEIYAHGRHGWALQAQLPTTRGAGLALSSTGNTAVIGGRIYTREGATWTEQATLAAGAETSAAISARGETVLLGFPGTETVKEFAREGTKWSERPTPALKETPTPEHQLGFAVALSGSGNTALVGEPGTTIEPYGEGTAWALQNK